MPHEVLRELITPNDVVVGLRGADTAAAAAALLRQVLARRHFAPADIDRITDAVLRREQLSPTNCGPVAIPHARDARLRDFVIAVGVNPHGIADADPATRLMIAFVSPEQKRSEHLTLLSQLARFSRDARAVDAVAEAVDPDAVCERIRAAAGA